MSVERLDLVRELTLFVDGCEPNEQSNKTNMIFMLNDDEVAITIQEQKPKGNVYHYSAKINLETLIEIVDTFSERTKIPGKIKARYKPNLAGGKAKGKAGP